MNCSTENRLLERATVQLDRLTRLLLAELGEADRWRGELSSSALSTAVAVVALRQMDLESCGVEHRNLIANGLNWLARNANPDGGWGDTVRSRSNISTTALCWAAFPSGGNSPPHPAEKRAEQWLEREAGSLERLPQAILACYGKDKTFSVPILMTLAISGRLGSDLWGRIPALPFELSVLPRSFFGALRLPVVSYALPALIAIGNVLHHYAPSHNPLIRFLRNRCAPRALRVLEQVQPANGGFLEATPLTAFVTMSLAAAGLASNPVALKAASFLRASIRPDGSWPIDTDLSTWLTSLAIKALSSRAGVLGKEQRARLRATLLAGQTRVVHPYTGAAPGGWAWTNLPGGVPDADDTAGALLALHELGALDSDARRAAERGICWLMGLQNRDGGIPTFCRGWGTLPFDQSTPEITAHALSACARWSQYLDRGEKFDRSMQKALRFLVRNQGAEGQFVPLWFGNEHTADQANPVYGTAQVLIALNENFSNLRWLDDVRARAGAYLLATQQRSGGWGGGHHSPESLEETALAIEALTGLAGNTAVWSKGLERLLELLDNDGWMRPSPIGLYFARLWYFERLYPLIFSISALGKVTKYLTRPASAGAAAAF